MHHAPLTYPPLKGLARRASLRFLQQFGRVPQFVVAAPGRVNLIGEHTDYNGGFVLPMAIDRHVVVAGDAPSNGDATATVRCLSGEFDELVTFPASTELEPGATGWSCFVRGVVACLLRSGLSVPAFDCAIESNLPMGGGLSSSAALEVATATLIEAITGCNLDPLVKAKLCQQAEHDFVGMPCGLMDQLSSVFGRTAAVLLIDCEREVVRHIPLNGEVAVVVINSNVRHTLAGSPYADRRAACYRGASRMGVPSLRHATIHRLESLRDQLDETDFRRARHVISENQRTQAAADAISRSDWVTVGELMYESHVSMRDDFEISCPEIDTLVETARAIGRDGGVYGARLTGGGFGGSTVTLVRTDVASKIAEQITDYYRRHAGIEAAWFVPQAVAGAGVLFSGSTVATLVR